MRYIGSDLDPDPWKKLRIRIRRHDAGPSDPKWTFCKNNLRVLRAYINFSQRTALRQKILRTILYIYLLCTVYCTVDEDRRIYYSTRCSLFSMCLAAVLVSFHHVFELTNSLFLYLLNVCVFSSGSSHNSNFLYFFLPQL